MFTYMIIHDIKHPTESLINSLSEFVIRVKDQGETIKKLQKSNSIFKKLLQNHSRQKNENLDENILQISLQQNDFRVSSHRNRAFSEVKIRRSKSAKEI